MNKALIGKPDIIDTKYFRVILRKGGTTVDIYLKTRIDEAKAFYKKYESNEELLSKEELDKWKLYPNRGNVPYNAIILRDYNRWLFDYCFGK